MNNLFSEAKAAQTAAFFLHRAHGRMPVLKLMKLIYLAERRSYELHGEPFIGDTLVSMEHGPVLSRTLNRMNGSVASSADGWDSWIADREGHDVALSDPSRIRSPEQDLLALSDAELEILGETWNSFGHLSKFELQDLTHKICPEWEDPDGSSIPISFDKLFSALKFDAEQIKAIKARLAQQQRINAAVSSSE